MGTLIEFREVCKYYQMGDTTVKAADHISFQIRKGEFVAIVGQSGSGKSTCMNIIGCLDVPTCWTAGMWVRWIRTSWPPSGTRCWASSSSSTTCCPS